MHGVLRATSVTSIIFAVIVGGCCLTEVPDEVVVRPLMGTFEGEALDELRAGMRTDDERCEAACMMLADAAGYTAGQVQSCEAIGGDNGGDGDGDGDGDDLPTWDAAQTVVSVMCSVETFSPGHCT